MKNKNILNKIIKIIDEILITSEEDFLELEQCEELLKGSSMLEGLVKKIVDSNIDLVNSDSIDNITSNESAKNLIAAYCSNNGIGLSDVSYDVKLKSEDICILDDDFKNYFRMLDSCPEPITDFEEQVKIFEKINSGDMEARKYFIEANLRLVIYIAQKYMYNNNFLEWLDLVQEGNIGLIEAVERFDVSKKCVFSTYAVWRIRRSILCAVRDKERAIRLPAHIDEKYKKIEKIRKQLEFKLCRQPSIEEIALEIGCDVEEIIEWAKNTDSIISLNAEINNHGDENETDEVLDFIKDERKDIELEAINSEFSSIGLDKLFVNARLSAIEVNVLKNRFGINEEKCIKTLRELADEYGKTYQRIEQIEADAIRKIRNCNSVFGYSVYISDDYDSCKNSILNERRKYRAKLEERAANKKKKKVS